MVFKEHRFAGWLQLILGGDETGEANESDGAAVGGGGGGVSSFGDMVPNPFSVSKDASVDLLAAYHVSDIGPIEFGPVTRPDFIEWLLNFDRRVDPRFFPGNDFNGLRVGALAALVAVSRMGNQPLDGVEALTANLKSMSPEELKRAITSAQAIVRRAEAAQKSLETALSKRRKGGK